MTIDRLIAYHKYFERYPPVHVLVAGALKYQPANKLNGRLPALAKPPVLPDVEE